MFGFGKAKEPKEPKRQSYMSEDGKHWLTFGPDEPFVYEGKPWGLVRQGTTWPPVAADHGDRPVFWQAVAEALNNLGSNRFIVKKLRTLATDYRAGKISATQVTEMVLKIVDVSKDMQVGGE